MIEGFEYTAIEVGPTGYRPGMAGAGTAGAAPPRISRRRTIAGIGSRRASPRAHTVVVCDLKGYGESRSEPGGELGEGYSTGSGRPSWSS